MLQFLPGAPTEALRNRVGSEGLLRNLPAASLEALIPLLEWVHVDGGGQVLGCGQPCQGMFILISGRLDVLDATGRLLGQVNPGEPIGEMSLLTDQPHSATVRASRDSILVRLSKSTFPEVVENNPAVLLAMSRILVERLRRQNATARPERRVIALVALAVDAPVRELAVGLERELSRFGTTAVVDRDRVDRVVGPGAANAPRGDSAATHFVDFLHDIESGSQHVLLVAEEPNSAWAQRCSRHADLILLAGRAQSTPRQVVPNPTSTTVSRELVLVQPQDAVQPSSAMAWRQTVGVDTHHHVRLESNGDVARLARHIAGRSISLVLAGGAVRGFAHVGVLKVLEEAKIPIDLIAGTSIGSVIGALAAIGMDHKTLDAEMREWFVKRSMIDLTAPIVAVMAGRRMERWSKRVFGDRGIEDVWRPFRAVSSSLLHACRVVHRTGLIRIAIRASSSVPGLLPPVVLDGDVLVDGLAMDNLPVGVAQSDTQGRIIAANVVPPAEPGRLISLASRGVLSHMLHMADPRAEDRQPPLFQYLMQANFLGTIGQAERKRSQVAVFIEPLVGHLGFMSATVYDEAVRLGEEAARKALDGFVV